MNSVHEFLQGPEVKCACSSGEESILLYQVESLASSRQVHACLLPAAAWRSDMSGNLHSVQPVQCANVTGYKPLIKYNFKHGAELVFKLAGLKRRDCKVRQEFIVA